MADSRGARRFSGLIDNLVVLDAAFPLEVHKAKIKQEGLDFRLAGEVPPSNICMGPKQLPPFWPPQRMDSQVSKGGNMPVQWASHWTARKNSS